MLHSEVERLALRHVPGDGAVTVERLGVGLVNESYRVMRNGRPYSLRIPSPHGRALGLDHEWECRVLECAAAEGIAPHVECCDACEGILVMRFAPGRVWTPDELRVPANLERIAQLARRIHRLHIPDGARTMGPAEWIGHYRQAPAPHEGLGLGDLQSALADHLAEHAALPPAVPVLCHSDLHLENIVVGEHGLMLLDWEYAHVSEPLWDLAGWIGNNDLSADCAELLLARYLERQPTEAESARLRLLAWLYDYTCLAWIELYLKMGLRSGESMSGRAQALMSRLRR